MGREKWATALGGGLRRAMNPRCRTVSKTSRSAGDKTKSVEIRDVLRLVGDDTVALRPKMRIAATVSTLLDTHSIKTIVR